MRHRRHFAHACLGLVMAAGTLAIGWRRGPSGRQRHHLGRQPRRPYDPRFRCRHRRRVNTIAMAANSQPGDLAYAKGKLYVAEEFGTPPAIAILDAETGDLIKPLYLHDRFASASRACQFRREPGRGRALRHRHGCGHRYARRHPARTVGQRSHPQRPAAAYTPACSTTMETRFTWRMRAATNSSPWTRSMGRSCGGCRYPPFTNLRSRTMESGPMSAAGPAHSLPSSISRATTDSTM